jgi:GT2 family glycosyltransferase
MDVLVSFGNVQTPGRPLLGLLDTRSLSLRAVGLPEDPVWGGGFTGLAVNDAFLFATTQPSTAGGASSDLVPPALLVFDRTDFRLVKRHVLHGLADLRALVATDDGLYSLSAGTDELVELKLRGPERLTTTCIWRPEPDGARGPVHRLTSLAVHDGEIIVAGLGKQSDAHGTSTREEPHGFVFNVTRNQQLAGGLDQPTAIAVADGRVLYSAPSSQAVQVLGGGTSRNLGGYPHALCTVGSVLLIGTSSRMADPVVDSGAAGRCSLTFVSSNTLEIQRSVDLGGYGLSVAVLLPVDGATGWPVIADADWRDLALTNSEARIARLAADAENRRREMEQRDAEIATLSIELENARQYVATSHRTAMEQIEAASERAARLHEMVMDLNRQVAGRTDQIREQIQHASGLQNEIRDRQLTIDVLRREIAERMATIASTQRTVETHARTIMALEAAMENRDEAITWLKGEVRIRDEFIATIQAHLAYLRSSRFWQLANEGWRLKGRAESVMRPGKRRATSGAGIFGGEPLRAPDPLPVAASEPSPAAAAPARPQAADMPSEAANGAGAITPSDVLAPVSAPTALSTAESGALAAAATPLGEALASLVTLYEARFGSSPVILDWTRNLDLSAFLPAGAVFAPPFPDATLPYFDTSIDVVAVEAHDRHRLDEARRVAAGCVVQIDGDALLPAVNGTPRQDVVRTIDWCGEAPAQPLPSVAIVIPVFNKSNLTNDCLEVLLPTIGSGTDVEVIVVDDASTDDTPAVLEGWAARDSRIRSVRNAQNSGFIDTCNRGAAEATSDVILFLNNDTIPQPGWLEPILRLFRDDPLVGVVGSKLLFADGRLQEAGGVVFKDGGAWNIGRDEPDAESPPYTHVREVDFCSGAVLATPRAVWEEIGGFDTRFRPAYYEDVDYCFTVRRRGLKVVYQPQSSVIHLEGGTGGTDLSAGAKQYQVVNHQKFLEKWQSVLADRPLAPLKPNRAGYYEVIDAPGTKRILVSAPMVPEFDREGGSRRLFHLIEYLVADGWSVTFLAPQGQRTNRYKRILEQLGVCVYLEGDTPLIGEAYATEAERLFAIARFDVAILAFWNLAEQYMPLIRRSSPKTRIVVDSIDLHFVRQARGTFAPHTRGWEARTLDARYADAMVRELNTYAEADLVLTVSQKEADVVNDLTGDRHKAWSVPLTDDLPPSELPLDARRGILFLGNFRHPPNVEALEFLCREVVPLLDEQLLAEHPIWVVGTGLDDRIRLIADTLRHIHMIGWVPVTTPYLHRARISAVPLLHGAGMKSKMVQTLMAATPAVSTNIGVEGMELVDEEHVLVANSPREVADGITRLLTDDALWQKLATAGREQVMREYSREVIRDLFLAGLNGVMEAAPATRSGGTAVG